ncbi:MAG: DMT family transporter [Actinobacteria bacterium]|nr:DMT family transporter [Actinomycetota bacterium]
MLLEIALALAASLFTAASSVSQRVAAAPAPGELTFSYRLVLFVLHRPIWFLGVLCMIGGFLFQLAALRVGSLSLVQPVIATELLFVFAFLAIRNRDRVLLRDWIAALGMAIGLAAFLFLAAPTGGSNHASGRTWILAGISCFVASGVIAALANAHTRKGMEPSPARKAALLAVSSGVAWGFVAAVIKELSTHVNGGWVDVFSNWSPYVLIVAGAAAMFLTTNAFQAGPLAASQPGLTIMDPLVAILLGVTVFGEQIRHTPVEIVGEVFAFVLIVGSVVLLSQSSLIAEGGEASAPPGTKLPKDAIDVSRGDVRRTPPVKRSRVVSALTRAVSAFKGNYLDTGSTPS